MATAHADRCRRPINLNSQTRQPWSADDSTDCSAPVWACASESSAILRRCICAFVSFPSEPAQRPVRRTTGRVCLSHVRRRKTERRVEEESEGCVYVPRVRRQHPRLSTDGQCRSTARWDCHFRVVPPGSTPTVTLPVPNALEMSAAGRIACIGTRRAGERGDNEPSDCADASDRPQE